MESSSAVLVMDTKIPAFVQSGMAEFFSNRQIAKGSGKIKSLRFFPLILLKSSAAAKNFFMRMDLS